MGLILDTDVLIAGERRGRTIRELIASVHAVTGDGEAALSTISIVELTHGIYRARADSDRERRQLFCDELCRNMIVHPVSVPIAQLAGRIEGEQAARGVSIAFEDLLIGATALHLGFDIVRLNVRHFKLIPELRIVTL